jgi:hypothetical protein
MVSTNYRTPKRARTLEDQHNLDNLSVPITVPSLPIPHLVQATSNSSNNKLLGLIQDIRQCAVETFAGRFSGHRCLSASVRKFCSTKVSRSMCTHILNLVCDCILGYEKIT